MREAVAETMRVRSLVLELPAWRPHRAGQHYDVRLTAADGYQAERSYSVASPPEDEGAITLTIERLEDGEVSPYLHDVVEVGDQFELRGPIGGYFVWDEGVGGPLLLVAGGSGIVPLMAMLRHQERRPARVPTRCLFSWRTAEDVIYRDELDRLAAAREDLDVFHTFTRQPPPGWDGYARRVDAEMMAEVAFAGPDRGRAYCCGPNGLVETAAGLLVHCGMPPTDVLTERYGPTGAMVNASAADLAQRPAR